MTRAQLVLAFVLAVSAALSAACDKSGDSGGGGAASATATASAPSPSASAATVAASAPSAIPSATDTASAVASTVPPAASSAAVGPGTSSATPSATATASAKPAPKCGDKPLPPCPLYSWMKANTSAAMSSQDFDALAKALDRVVSFAPPGYGNWASISRDGANAARAQNLDAVKASCRGCHNQYKDRYKKEMRDRPI